MNLQLTGSLQKQLNQISEVGSKSEIGFAKSVGSYDSISKIQKENPDFGLLLGMLFTQVNNLLGIKEGISDNNKQDIKEMLFMRFKNISPEEIQYAFKLERFGLLGERTSHYQLFNAEYVSTVLDKYKKWLQKQRQDNNLSLPESKPEMTAEQIAEKERIEKHSAEVMQIININFCYDEWKESKTISLSYSGVFDRFIEKGIIKDPKAPKYQKYLAKKIQEAKEMLIKGYEVQGQREYASKNAIRELIKEVKSGLSPKIEEKAKCLVLEDYFSKIEKDGLEFKEILSKYWNTEVVKDSKYDL